MRKAAAGASSTGSAVGAAAAKRGAAGTGRAGAGAGGKRKEMPLLVRPANNNAPAAAKPAAKATGKRVRIVAPGDGTPPSSEVSGAPAEARAESVALTTDRAIAAAAAGARRMPRPRTTTQPPARPTSSTLAAASRARYAPSVHCYLRGYIAVQPRTLSINCAVLRGSGGARRCTEAIWWRGSLCASRWRGAHDQRSRQRSRTGGALAGARRLVFGAHPQFQCGALQRFTQ